MTGARESRAPGDHQRFRSFLGLSALVLFVAVLVPPIASLARRYEFAESFQFCVFAYAVPALLVTGAPWKRLGLASGEPVRVGENGEVLRRLPAKLMDRYAERAARRTGHVHIFTVGLIFLGVLLAWRSAPAVNALITHPWLVGLEAITLVGTALPVWLSIVESPPVGPSTTRPFRIGVAAVVMWAIWVTAYLNGMSQSAWYGALHYGPGGLSHIADQEFAAAVMWAMSAATMMPVVFWNLIHWLQAEEDPDAELDQLVRDDRLRGTHDASA